MVVCLNLCWMESTVIPIATSFGTCLEMIANTYFLVSDRTEKHMTRLSVPPSGARQSGCRRPGSLASPSAATRCRWCRPRTAGPLPTEGLGFRGRHRVASITQVPARASTAFRRAIPPTQSLRLANIVASSSNQCTAQANTALEQHGSRPIAMQVTAARPARDVVQTQHLHG